MLKKVTISSSLKSVTMELAYPGKSGYAIISIDGLGPSSSVISFNERANMHGAIYKSSRTEKRNIVFQIRIVDKDLEYTEGTRDIRRPPSVETLRQDLYSYFPSNEPVEILLETDNRTVKTTGYVEKHEPNIFSKEVEVSVSILCPDAFFKDVNELIVPFSSVNPVFSFPFQNASLTEKLIEFSEIVSNGIKTINYLGDAKTGFLIQIHARGPATGIQLYDGDSLVGIAIDADVLDTIIGGPLENGDDIFISSVKGNKYAELVRGTETFNILPALGRNPNWLELHKGYNNIAYIADTGVTLLDFKLTAPVLYEGV